MATREWQRGFLSQIWTPGQGAQVGDPFVIGETFSPTLNDTLLRVFVEAHCTIRLKDADAVHVGNDWWNETVPYVCVGRGVHPGDTSLDGGFGGDARITGAGTLGLKWVQQGLNGVAETTAKWELSQTIESQGQRKPLPGGAQPTAQVTIGCQSGTGQFFLDSLTWRVVWWVWIRSLWETP